MISLLSNRLVIIGAVVALVIGGIVWLRVDAVQKERARQEAEEMRRNIDTRKRIDDAINNPRTPADIIERLRQLAQ